MSDYSSSAPPKHPEGLFGHPRGLMTLFFTEMWERFSYYGMRAILMLFMTTPIVAGGLGFGPDKAGPIYAMYTSMVYLATVPGGWLADNFLGQRKSVFWGGLVIMTGHISLAMHGLTFFYLGLALVVVGTGLLKPNISVIVGQLYEPEDARRDAGFSIFYMGINMGAFLAPLVCGYLAQDPGFKSMLEGWGMNPANSWHWGFGAAAVGMFFGLLQYLLTARNLGDAGLKSSTASPEVAAKHRRTLIGGLVAFALAGVALFMVDRQATHLDTLRWEPAAGGVTASGTVAGSPGETVALHGGAVISVGDLNRYMGAEAAARARLTVALDELTAGNAGGEMKDAYLSVELPGAEEDETRAVRLKDVTWTTVEGQLEIVGTSADTGEELVLATLDRAELERAYGAADMGLRDLADPKKPMIEVTFGDDEPEPVHAEEAADPSATVFDDGLAELKEPVIEGIFARAVEAGRAQGSLDGVDVKVGGLNAYNINTGFAVLLFLVVVGFFGKLFLMGDWTRSERARLVTIFVLFCGAAIFWGIFEQAGSTLTLFADRSTNNSFLGFQFPSSWWQSLNAILIVLLAPFFAWLWVRLGKRNPSYPTKFAVGILFAGLGFAVLVGGASMAEGGRLVSPLWLFAVYLLHTIGELCLSPVGLSSMTKLAPVRVVSLMMGVWFLAASVGNFIGGSVSGLYEDFALPNLFGIVALSGGVMSLVMFALVIPIRNMMQASEEETKETA